MLGGGGEIATGFFVHSLKKIPAVLSLASFTAPNSALVLLRKTREFESRIRRQEKTSPNGLDFSWRGTINEVRRELIQMKQI
jgi:hypothetical protein